MSLLLLSSPTLFKCCEELMVVRQHKHNKQKNLILIICQYKKVSTLSLNDVLTPKKNSNKITWKERIFCVERSYATISQSRINDDTVGFFNLFTDSIYQKLWS